MSSSNQYALLEPLEDRRLMSTYYVSPSGNDAAAGSNAAPFKTLQRAANLVKAGDTVNVVAGKYSGFNLETSGSAAAPITFKAQAGVVIDSKNSKTADGINLESASYVVIDGFTVNNDGTITRAGIRSVTNKNVVIRNNKIDGCGKWGIFTAFSESALIENNVASNSKGEHGIYFSNSADNPVIRGNTIFGNARCGLHMNGDASMGGDGVISGALVENNVIYNNGVGGGSAINCDGVQNSTIQNNLLYGNHSSGISLYAADGAAGSKNNTIVNNTILMASDARWALNIQNASTGNTALNNILYNGNSSRGSIDISGDSQSGFVSDYNVVMDRLSKGGSFQSLAQWRTSSGQDTHSFIATPDKLFVNAAGNDYRLAATTAAINKGTATKAPKTDRIGTTRPTGGGVDIGSHEYTTATTQPQTPPPSSGPVQTIPEAPRTFCGPMPAPWLYQGLGEVRFGPKLVHRIPS